MAEISCRRARSGDQSAVADVYRRSSLSNAGDREMLLTHPDALEFDPGPIEDGLVTVAVEGPRIVGFATIRPEAGAARFAELDDLFVDPDVQRRGIGRLLVDDVARHASDLGADRIEVTGNEHARAFYDAVGFREIGVAETRFGPAVRMALQLKDQPPADA